METASPLMAKVKTEHILSTELAMEMDCMLLVQLEQMRTVVGPYISLL